MKNIIKLTISIIIIVFLMNISISADTLRQDSWVIKTLRKLVESNPDYVEFGPGLLSGKSISRFEAAKIIHQLSTSGKISSIKLLVRLMEEFDNELKTLNNNVSSIDENVNSLKMNNRELRKKLQTQRKSRIKINVESRTRFESNSYKLNSNVPSQNRNNNGIRNRINIIIN